MTRQGTAHQVTTGEPATIDGVLRRRAADTPDAPVLGEYTADGLAVWSSAADLDRLARRVGGWLAARGTPGDRVLVCPPPGLAFTGAFFGCLYAGRVAVPVPVPGRFAHERRRLAAIAADADVSAVLTGTAGHGPVGDWLAERELDIPVLDVERTDDAAPDGWQPVRNHPETLALLQYTSGSTGTPKGVMVSHGNVVTNVEVIRRGLDLPPAPCIGGWLPPHHDMGLIGELLMPLLLGGRAVAMEPMAFLRRPHRWLRMIGELGVDMSTAPNFAYELCTRRVTDEQLAELDLSRWSVALNAAEPISGLTIDRFTTRFAAAGMRPEAMATAYGLAESTLFVTGAAHRRPVVRGQAHRRRVGCGPAPDTVAVVDPDSRRGLGDGRIGEIWVRGPSVAQGYWQAPASTAATFHAVALDGVTEFLRTGDLGTVVDGELYVVGRLKETIVIRGRTLHPHDIEEEVRMHHPALASGVGAAFGVASAEDGELLVLVHEVAAGTPRADLPDLASSVRHVVAREIGVELAGLVLVRPGTVTRTTSGKIERAEMRRRFAAGELTGLHAELSDRLPSER